MNQVLLYVSLIVASVSFFLCCYACWRVGKLLNSVKGLDWDTIATLTGDIGTIKKSIQTLNNRINGLNSPKLNDELLHYALKQQTNVTDIKSKNIGG
jgi:cell division protein FtsB